MSAVDTSMYDPLIRPVAPQSPIDLATKGTELQNALQRSKLLPAEIQQRQEEANKLRLANETTREDQADQQTLQQVYGEVQNDSAVPAGKKLDELRSRLAGKVKPRTLEALSKSIQEHQEGLGKLHDQELKQAKEAADEVGNTAQGILAADPKAQPALYAQERQRLINQGVATADQVPEQFDPNYLKTAAAHAMGAKNAIDAELAGRKEAREQAEADRKTRTDELAQMGQTVDGVTDQASYTAWRNKLSDANKALTAATFTPANVKTIKRMALTANQQREADQAARTADETQRHDEALEGKKPDAKTYTGQMRAALVAAGAVDPDNPTKEEADKALDRVKPPTNGAKPVPKSTLVGIETRKAAAIAKSKSTLDKEITTNTSNGKAIDQAAIDQAWEDHIERVQNAQLAYENELTTATGNDVGHNDWADRLRAPGNGAASPAGAPAGAAPSAPGGQPAAAAAADPAKIAKAKALVPKYSKDQVVMLRGKKVKITSIDEKTGDFQYDPVP